MEQRGIVLSCVWGHGDPHSFYCRVFLTENQSTVAISSPVIAVLATLWLLINRICFYFLFLYGWIAGRWEAHFRNYRHFVSQCSVSTLDWLPNFPHKAWVDPGEGSFTCQVNRRELSVWGSHTIWGIYLFILITQARLCFRMMAVISLMWTCI